MSIKLCNEVSLSEFNTWAGATDTVEHLTNSELETLTQIIADAFPEGMTDTELNDFLWFERDTIAEWLGYNDFDEILDRD